MGVGVVGCVMELVDVTGPAFDPCFHVGSHALVECVGRKHDTQGTVNVTHVCGTKKSLDFLEELGWLFGRNSSCLMRSQMMCAGTSSLSAHMFCPG